MSFSHLTRKWLDIYRVGFKGVHKIKSGRYAARIKGQHLGVFDDKCLAARAYDMAAIETFGKFASTNKDLGLL
jgi:hypothetical protein